MSKRKLLLADDSVTIQKVVNLTFADEGVDIITVGDGNSAMDKIREESLDLIMADVNMPGLNGYEICEKVREMDGDSKIPVILLVGSFEPFDEAEAKRVGADDFLTKPFQSINQLVNTVTVLLNSEGFSESDTVETETEIAAIATVGSNEGFGAPTVESSFDDHSIDDEMIQTDQIGSLPVDDVSRFEVPESLSVFSDVEGSDTEEAKNDFGASEQEDEPREYSIVETENSVEASDHGYIQEAETERLDPQQLETASFGYSPVVEEEQTGFTEQDSDNPSFNVAEASRSEAEVELDEGNLLELPVVEKNEAAQEESLVEDKESEVELEALEDEGSEEIAVAEDIEQSVALEEEPSDVEFGTLDSDDEIESSDQASPVPKFEIVANNPPYVDTETNENDFTTKEEIDSDAQVQDPFSPEVIDEITRKVEANLSEKASLVEQDQSVAAVDPLSDEVIEEITKRVLEKLSDKAVKEVAWEVVPKMSDRIVRQIAEEKMKE